MLPCNKRPASNRGPYPRKGKLVKRDRSSYKTVQLSVLDERIPPNPLQVIADSDIEEGNDANMTDPDGDEDIDIKL